MSNPRPHNPWFPVWRLLFTLAVVMSVSSFILILMSIWNSDYETSDNLSNTATLFGVPGVILGVLSSFGMADTYRDDHYHS